MEPKAEEKPKTPSDWVESNKSLPPPSPNNKESEGPLMREEIEEKPVGKDLKFENDSVKGKWKFLRDDDDTLQETNFKTWTIKKEDPNESIGKTVDEMKWDR